MKASVRVPATSANIGCGFDSFGLALPIYNTITIEVRNYKNDLIKTIEFEAEGKYYYRPLSMDAGYEFIFKTCRF